MHTVLRNENWSKCLIYLDDVLIFGRTVEEHSERLRAVLQRFREANLKLSPEKCVFLQNEVAYLGHVVSKDGLKTCPKKTEKVSTWPTPKTQEELHSFLGLCGYYRRHILNYAQIVAPLEKLLQKNWNKNTNNKKKRENFIWQDHHDEAFEKLKWALTHAPVLTFPTRDDPYVLDTDASHDTIGAVLSQVQNGVEKVIAYASHRLSKSEKQYCVTRKELLAVYKYVKHFNHYLYGRKFLIRTDHQALVWLLNWKKPNTSQYCSWIAELETYDMQIEHRPGKQHVNADALSRIPQCQQCEIKHTDPRARRQVKQLSETPESNSQSQHIVRRMVVNTVDQEQDPDIHVVLSALRNKKAKDSMPSELSAASRIAKLLWKKRADLRIQGGQLFLTTPESRQYLFVVPYQERKRLICSAHRGSGHIGITKTIALLKEKYYWPEMEDDIRLLINSCMPCLQRKSAGAQKMPPLQFTVTGFPFERIAIDVTGPLPMSKSGHRYILGIIDYFSKYPMLLPIKNMEAKTIAEAIFNHWICTFGAPDTIHSDRGTCFEAEIFHNLCQLSGIRKTKTAPYYPQSDGLVERLFRTVKDMLFATTKTYGKDWKEVLPIVAMGLRSSVQRTTGISPHEALFGRTMKTPIEWVNPSTSSNPPHEQNISEFVVDLKEKLQKIHQLLRENFHKKHIPSNTNFSPWNVNDYVMAKVLPLQKGVDKPRYYGPFVITERLGLWTYRLKHISSGEMIDRNIHHLKKINRKIDTTQSLTAKKSVTPAAIQSNSRPRRPQHIPLRYGFA
jgi:hypothetical protein